MALRIWLPLNGSLENKGISDYEIRSANITIADDGKIGKCYSFNGSNSYINITNFEIGNNWSYGCWVNTPNSDSRGWEIVMILNNSGSDADSQFAFWVHQKENRFESLANTQYVSTIPYTNYYNNWHHFFATFNGTLLTTYIDGNVVNTKTITATQYNAVNLTIGARSTNAAGTSFAGWFQGKLNDIRVYDHCLSPLEVKEISQGLVLHYKLDGFSGGAGENILTGTNYNSYSSSLNATTATNASGKWCGGSGGNGTFSVIEDFTCPVGNLSWNISNNTSGNRDFQQGNQPYVGGQQYTTSFWAKGSGTCLYRSWNSTDGKQMFSKTWTLTSDWVYYTHTFTASAEMETDLCTFHLGVTGNSNISICGMKMEKGSIATAWSPAPQDLGIDTTKITDSSGYGNDGFLVNGTNEVMGVNNGRYQVCTSLLGTTVDNSSKTIVGAQYLYAPFKMPAWNAITVAWWGNNIAYGRGGIFETTGTTGNIWEGSDYNTTAIANWDSTFGIFNGTTRINIFNNFVKDSTWHYHTITFDGINVKYYCDSILKQTSALTGTLPAITGFKMGLGRAGGVYRQIKQKLNDLRIYATALSAEDVLDLYHTPANIDNLGGIHGFEFIEKTPNLLNPDPREWAKESSVTCVWNEETGYFDVNTNRDTSVTSRWGVYTGVPIKPNTTYLFSAEVLDNKSYIGVAGGTSSRSLPSNIISWNGEKRYYYFFTTSSSHTHAWVYLCSKPSETTAGHFKNIYLGEVGEIASIKQSGIFENEDMVEYNENGRITKSGELAGSNFIEK